ncbi:ubiquinol-cytochrome c reductase [Adhaeribacter aerolatus]|uniref:Ubiquinol-cytochrome c reductase n=1 Tax=Adhaeribacter aerolatus TaxID=670289 RepID=A0A512B370_9BACT|nr:EVE domain-containing protein [Adhaeribacter aerolatus]GEO06409.1 ubiquinol-cytochrome c reductase [Adhaeribacter aerolatus]
MQYWLVKSEPEAYSWADLVKDGNTAWTGVRNYQARNNLGQMKKDDLVLFYHSVSEKAVVGIARVAQEAYPDSTTDDARWVAVDLAPETSLKKEVTLDQIKKDSRLENISLLKQSRLSVMPLKPEEFDLILGMSN